MIVDLHAHYPMHLLPEAPGDPLAILTQGERGDRWRDRVNQALVRFASRFANYESPSSGPGVTVERMLEGGVDVCCSVLYSVWDEFDLTLWRYGEPPRPSYFQTLQRQIETVERRLAEHHAGEAVLCRDPRELDAALDAGTLAFVHMLEGGFHVGHDAAAIDVNVAALAEAGVASIAPAHLIYRGIATNAPAFPFLRDWQYHLLFRQPRGVGLSELGRALVAAMVREGIVVDITHMSRRALHDTFALLDQLDPGRTVPVVASHMACRFGSLEYNVTDDTIVRVAERGGAIGVLFCRHYVTDGLDGPASTFEETVEALCRHVDRLERVTGGHDVAALGSDLDGYIKPMLTGLEHMGRMRDLAAALEDRYGAEVARKITGENALRVLRAGWRR